jgi:CheY-like chemotaxis protein
MESRSYDVVLCDLNLKSVAPSAISGQELYARVTRLAAGITPERATRLAAGFLEDRKPLFIFMTGDLAEGTTVEGLTGAEVRTLQKPFRISEVAALLTEVLDHARSRDSQTAKTQ